MHNKEKQNNRCDNTRPTTYSVWINLFALGIVYPTATAPAAIGAASALGQLRKTGATPRQLPL